MPFKNHLLAAFAVLNRHKWLLLVLFCGVLLPLHFFSELAEEMHEEGGVLPFDEPTLLYIRQFATPNRDAIVYILTVGGAWLTPFFLGAMVWALRKMQPATATGEDAPLAANRRNWSALWSQPRDVLFFLLATGGSWGLNLLAKMFYRRDRPDLWVSVTPKEDYSFPSGHSMVSMAIALALIHITWRTRWRWPVILVCLPGAVAIAFSRLYLGVHYPSDVLGGWCAAVVWVTGLSAILPRRETVTVANVGEGIKSPLNHESARK